MRKRRTEDGDDEAGRVDRREHVVLEDEEREEDDGDLFEDSCDRPAIQSQSQFSLLQDSRRFLLTG